MAASALGDCARAMEIVCSSVSRTAPGRDAAGGGPAPAASPAASIEAPDPADTPKAIRAAKREAGRARSRRIIGVGVEIFHGPRTCTGGRGFATGPWARRELQLVAAADQDRRAVGVAAPVAELDVDPGVSTRAAERRLLVERDVLAVLDQLDIDHHVRRCGMRELGVVGEDDLAAEPAQPQIAIQGHVR